MHIFRHRESFSCNRGSVRDIRRFRVTAKVSVRFKGITEPWEDVCGKLTATDTAQQTLVAHSAALFGTQLLCIKGQVRKECHYSQLHTHTFHSWIRRVISDVTFSCTVFDLWWQHAGKKKRYWSGCAVEVCIPFSFIYLCVCLYMCICVSHPFHSLQPKIRSYLLIEANLLHPDIILRRPFMGENKCNNHIPWSAWPSG